MHPGLYKKGFQIYDQNEQARYFVKLVQFRRGTVVGTIV